MMVGALKGIALCGGIAFFVVALFGLFVIVLALVDAAADWSKESWRQRLRGILGVLGAMLFTAAFAAGFGACFQYIVH